MGHERERDGWLGTTLRQSPATAPDGCLDAETLAAWVDGGLTAQAAAAVDLHASTCSRCMAVIAAMERTAPAAPARHAWTPARLFRWLVPLTAAATAVAIWIAIPDRPVTPVIPAPAQDLKTTSEGRDADASAQERVPVPVPLPEPRTSNQNPAPSTKNPEPQEQFQLRDELRRERADAQSLGAAGRAAAVAEAPPPAPPAAAPAPAAPTAAASPAVSTDRLAETVTTTAQQRSALNKFVAPTESAAPSNPLIRWRVVASYSIERSTDGGKTWTRTTPPPGVAPNNTAALSVVAVRAVNNDRAVVRTSDGAEFYTTNGGLSWTRVQENSPTPF